MAAKPEYRVELDSVVIIDCLQKRAGRYEWIKPLIQDAEDGNLIVVVSTMAISETVKIEGKTTDEAKEIIREFYRKPWVVPVTPSLFISELSQEIQRNHPIDCVDAVHLATALFTKTPFFLTNDGDSSMKKKRNKRPILALDNKISHEGMTLRIMTPKDYYENRRAIGLFAEKSKPEELQQDVI